MFSSSGHSCQPSQEMKRRRTIGVVVVTGVAATVSVLVVLVSSRGAEASRNLSGCAGARLKFKQPEKFRGFKLYALGCEWRGLRLYGTDFVVSQPPAVKGSQPPKRTWAVFLYGDCPTVGCHWPLEVQVWPACVRNRANYPGRREPVRVRGVPADWFSGRTSLELYTDRVTVVLFRGPGLRASDLRQAAEHLEGVNNSIRPGQNLPLPAPGATTGKLRC